MAGTMTEGATRGVPFDHYLNDGGDSQVPVVMLHPDSAAGGGGGGTTTVKELQSTTVAQGVVAVDTTIDQIVAADANRRRLIVTNDHASAKLGLSTEGTSTFAQCPIKLAAGESWVEALAANKAWYAIYDTGGSGNVPYQTVV